MNPKWTFADDCVELLHPEYTSILGLEAAARNKTALVNREHECAKQPPILSVEGDIDEYAFDWSSHVGSSGYRFFLDLAVTDCPFLRFPRLAALLDRLGPEPKYPRYRSHSA